MTKSLKRIAQKVSDQRDYCAEWKSSLISQKYCSTFRVTNLWAAGSWARGAIECGDLDLIAELSIIEGMEPPVSVVGRVVGTKAPDVRLYIGTPQDNSSGAEFDEAILIWSPLEPDWEYNIAMVRPDHTATRFQRKTDVLPLRAEHIAASSLEELENLVDLKESGIISWDWVDASEINPAPERWDEGSIKFLKRVKILRGKKTQDVMPLVIEHLSSKKGYNEWKICLGDRSVFGINGKKIIVGRPFLPIKQLDQLWCSCLVLVPHLTKRGPNGLWVIHRGQQHPLEQLFEGIKAYYLVNADEAPLLSVEMISIRREFNVIKLFSYVELANEEVDEEYKFFKEVYRVKSASGSELLCLISRIDALDVDYRRVAVTEEGRIFSNEKIHVSGAEEIRDLLAPR